MSKYIDIRFEISEEEDDGDIIYTIDGVELLQTDLPYPHGLQQVADSMAQMDKYQLMLAHDIPFVIWEG